MNMSKLIDEFKGEYDFLSNFYITDIEYEGIKYSSTEAAFQAAKIKCVTDDETARQRAPFANYSPSMAKKMGRKGTLRPDWEQVKDGIMLDLLRIKFKGDKDLKERLLETEDAVLVEGNTWHDCYWGDCCCPKCANKPGRNTLGKLLMRVREEIRKEEHR